MVICRKSLLWMVGHYSTLSHYTKWTAILGSLGWQSRYSTEWHASIVCHPRVDACSRWYWKYGVGEGESSPPFQWCVLLFIFLFTHLFVCFACRPGRSAVPSSRTPTTRSCPRLLNDGPAAWCSTFSLATWRLFIASTTSSCRYNLWRSWPFWPAFSLVVGAVEVAWRFGSHATHVDSWGGGRETSEHGIPLHYWFTCRQRCLRGALWNHQARHVSPNDFDTST